MTAAKKSAASSEKTEKPESELSDLVVTAPRIQVTVGSQVLQFSEGDVLPKDIDEESVKRLTDRGFIEKK